MLINSSPNRQALLLKLTRMNQELDSKGTVEDPVSRQLGWCQDRAVSLEHRLQDFQQPSLAQMRSAASARGKRRKLSAAALATGAVIAGTIVASNFSNPSLLVPLGIATTAGLSIAAFSEAQGAGQDARTAAELGQWNQAFQNA